MKKIHFVGIGGIGMSALADILIKKGEIISGSDLRPNNLTESLEKRGATIYEGHSENNLKDDTDLVIRSSCIRDANPELAAARNKGIEIISRGELLKLCMEDSTVSVSVTGTHGKTTTSSLIAHMLEVCGKEPTYLIGGEVETLGGNAGYGKSDIMVAEVDESDGYFRNIASTHAVITNIEREHMENYGSMEKLFDSYGQFISLVPEEGVLFYNGEDANLTMLKEKRKGQCLSFGIDGDFDATCDDPYYTKSIRFNLKYRGEDLGTIESSLIGRHNLMNILAAVSVCLELDVPFAAVQNAVKCFRGVARRFERIAKMDNIDIIEDYAHHPTEIAALLKAAKDYTEGRIIAVFQPHRHSRTNDLADDFMNCFDSADVLMITDVYSADEDPVEGIGIGEIYGRIDKTKFEKALFTVKKDIPDELSQIVKDGDMVLIMGAGDIRDISGEIVERIEARGKEAKR